MKFSIRSIAAAGLAACAATPAFALQAPAETVEAAATIAEWAIGKGCHVVMASKEAGIVVGPILSRMANKKVVVYTEVEGDQPSLLIGLNSWAETLGLEVFGCWQIQ